MKIKTTVITSIILLTICFSFANTIIVDAEDSGSYSEHGYHLETDSSRTGISDFQSAYLNYCSFFVFSIPEFNEDIIEVTLSLELTQYASYDEYEDIRISEVSTPIDQLVISHTYSDTGLAPWIYDDLMDGPELGLLQVRLEEPLFPFTQLASFQGQGPVFLCTFNETGIQMLQEAAGGKFALGLSLVSTGGDENEYVNFNPQAHPDFQIQQLAITTVPEPATMLLVVAGSILIKFRNRKK